ncbi:glycosyltransferase family 4 protein [Kerstersia gyiorum]|uniref:glycosyltransferase family 4 protein n=1 Tax=Kerstersia gyiorum TaxID=206506 RepID=UPI003B43B2A4
MTVCFVLSIFLVPGDRGATGGNISNYCLVSELAKNHQIILITPNLTPLAQQHLTNLGVKFYQNNLRYKNSFDSFRARSWLKRKLKDQLAADSTDEVYLIGSAGTNDIVYKQWKGNQRNQRLGLIVRAFEDFSGNRMSAPILRYCMKRFFLFITGIERNIRRAHRSADLIVTNSEYMRAEISAEMAVQNSRIKVIYPPLDIEFQPYRKRSTKFNRIGFINPSALKGESIMLALASDHPELMFRYFSRSDKKYNQKNIEYGGWVSNRNELFESIDLLIMPSRQEAFGRSAVEAVASGIPVLVSKNGGLPETVDERFIVMSDDPDDWFNSIIEFQDNPAKVEEIWHSSIEKIQQYTFKRHNESVSQLLKNDGRFING